MSAPVVLIDGRLCTAETAVVSVFDRGFLYGDGVFTVLRGRGGRAVELGAHLEQLRADAGLVALQVPEGVEREIARALEELGAERARVRVVVSRGVGGLSARLADLKARVVVIAEEAGPTRTEVRAVVVEEPRLLPSRTWAPKALAYQASLVARELAVARGGDEALRLFPDDTVGEGATSNLFVVSEDAVVTPPALGIRPGVTRRRVLALCARLGLAAVERPIPRAELAHASELFVTSSIAGVVPVCSLDGITRPAGPISTRLAAAYEAEVAALG